LLKFAMSDLNLSARAYDRVLKVARKCRHPATWPRGPIGARLSPPPASITRTRFISTLTNGPDWCFRLQVAP
jgi:hypothetical protein